MFAKLMQFIRQVVGRLIPYRNIEAVERIETPLSNDMVNALDLWYDMYRNKSPWLSDDKVKSLNLPSTICAEIARSVTLEMKWSITGAEANANGEEVMNPRAEYLKAEFERCIAVLQQKLEQGCAAGGMTIKPYPKDGHIYFDWTMDWSLYPIAFDDDGRLADVIFRDTYTAGKTIYSRLERHRVDGDSVHVTQRAFKSSMKDSIGTEISLSEVPQWAQLQPDVTVQHTGGQLFGWFRTATANNVDVDSPMGAAVFSRATDVIKDADEQYSRLLWEFEGSELAIDVDPMVLRPQKEPNGKTTMAMPRLNDRLFRGVDRGTDDSYDVFSPPIRDAALVNGLNQILARVESLCGLARGTLADVAAEARTATELRILKQRTYSTISGNQAALEACLRDVVRAMDRYATIYGLAPEGEYELSFEWDDSVITDTDQQMQERLLLLNAGACSKAELRQWYFGETSAQASAAIKAVQQEKLDEMAGMEALLPQVTPDQ